MKRIASVVASTGILTVGIFSASAQLSISNTLLQVNFNTASGQCSVTDFGSGRTFVTQGNFLLGSGGVATINTISNAALGSGQAIQIVYPNGNSDAIMLFTNLPFAVFQSTISNGTPSTVVSNRISPITLLLDNGESLSSLTNLGTGGLSAPGHDPGSYEWLAVVDTTNRNGIIGGWITDDRASGIVFSSTNATQEQLNPREDYGRLQILPGQTQTLEMFAVGYFADGRTGLEIWANTIAQIYNIHLNPQPDGYCTYPSSPNGGSSSPAAVEQLADCVKTNLEPFGFSMIQIDAASSASTWQAGMNTTNPYTGQQIGNREFLFVNPSGPYTNGMAPVANYLAADGITSGLWFSPCGSSATDPYFTNHLDWFVKTTNGQPYWVNFGGAVLDGSYSPARTYISNFVYQIANIWGYQYFKMDGLWSGVAAPQEYINSGYTEDGLGDAVYADPSQPNIQVFRDGLKLVRQVAGPSVYMDGCNIAQSMRAYGGSFGLVDGIRIGPDNGATWSKWMRSPTYGTRHYFLQGRVWHNDPDTVYVRTNFTAAQAQTIASWYGISGQLTLDGDWIPGLPAARLDMLKRILPHHGLMPRPVDYFENDPPQIWLLTDTRYPTRRDVIGLFNWSTNATQHFNVSLSHIGLPGTSYIGFEFWSNTLVPLINGNLQATVPPQSCQIIAVRPAASYPQLISTSRHVTQGIVDVLAENWDGARTLSGTSQLVGGDSYELRIYSTNGWNLQSASVSAADQAAGVTVACAQSNGLARVTLQSPTSRQVNWSTSFFQGIPQPVANSVSVSGSNLIIGGSNGLAVWPYYVLTSTNLSLPLSSWMPVATGLFDIRGNFSFTNGSATNVPGQFYLLQVP